MNISKRDIKLVSTVVSGAEPRDDYFLLNKMYQPCSNNLQTRSNSNLSIYSHENQVLLADYFCLYNIDNSQKIAPDHCEI